MLCACLTSSLQSPYKATVPVHESGFILLLGKVVYSYIPSTQEAEPGELVSLKGQPGLCAARPLLKSYHPKDASLEFLTQNLERVRVALPSLPVWKVGSEVGGVSSEEGAGC